MLNPEQKERRRHSLGSSEISAVLGVDSHATAADVWLSKRGMVEDFEGNDATDRGIRLEPVLLDFAEFRTGLKFERGMMFTHESGLLHTNFDGIEWLGPGDEPKYSVEAKTTAILTDWGTEGTDEVPMKVIAQVQHGFACVPSLRKCYVPVLLPGYQSLDFRLYEVERSDEAVEIIVERATDFMELVRKGIRPTQFEPSTETLRRMRRQPGKIVDIPDFLGEEFEASRRARLDAEKAEKESERKILATLLDGDAIRYDGKVIEYREMKREMPRKEAYTQVFRQWMFPRAKKQNKQKERVGA